MTLTPEQLAAIADVECASSVQEGYCDAGPQALGCLACRVRRLVQELESSREDITYAAEQLLDAAPGNEWQRAREKAEVIIKSIRGDE